VPHPSAHAGQQEIQRRWEAHLDGRGGGTHRMLEREERSQEQGQRPRGRGWSGAP